MNKAHFQTEAQSKEFKYGQNAGYNAAKSNNFHSVPAKSVPSKKPVARNDEDDEIRLAIELSKQTA